jgi:hypothetical protein
LPIFIDRGAPGKHVPGLWRLNFANVGLVIAVLIQIDPNSEGS